MKQSGISIASCFLFSSGLTLNICITVIQPVAESDNDAASTNVMVAYDAEGESV